MVVCAFVLLDLDYIVQMYRTIYFRIARRSRDSSLQTRSLKRIEPPGAGVQKSQNAKPGSLASRIGVPKRSASTGNFRGTKPKPAPATAPSTPKKHPINNRQPNAERLLNALQSGSGQATVRAPRGGLSINGASGPFVVMGSNFAPGTTAADSQSALKATSDPMLTCRVISHKPTVTAKFAFENKWNAGNVVASLHHQRADGRLLSMTFKPTASAALTTNHNDHSDLRVQADRERQNQLAGPTVQDCRFGFIGKAKPSDKKQSSGLYSDQIMVDAATTEE
ncbi:hypothetical protein N7520_002257 [Penicillium odoratum]|uniref:uncharacterized protein n=1 Tax=Penicillium odoratum TaxID=1167516 RepID=UPI0025486C9E|nr:uncharacterized protein N7520_002257 [Penicillium odoratum]KAJ5771728.1 hypothetical protein N7520_002257 [Penicillium odoratum]